MKTIVPTNLTDMKSSLDSWKSAFENTFKQLVDKGKELQQVTEQFFVPQYSKDFPRMDILEGDKELFVVFELPGLTKEEFNLEIGGGLLFLRGEKKNPLQKKAVGIHIAECSYGKFERTINIPAKIIEDQIVAEFNMGVLIITLPKAEAQIHQKVTISVR